MRAGGAERRTIPAEVGNNLLCDRIGHGPDNTASLLRAGFWSNATACLWRSTTISMHRLLLILGFLGVASLSPTFATASDMRFALVIGNGAYKTHPLATPVNDAALIAQTLKAAGFQVISERDLNGENLRKAFGDFADRIKKAGPDAVAAVYFAGYGLQLEGENYLFPIDADMVAREAVPARAVRLSEQMRSLTALRLKASFLILDAARTNSSLMSGSPPAGGLAWVEPEPNMLIAFSAAPGTVASEVSEGGYGPYAKALAEMIRDGGRSPLVLFDRVRLRVNELTKGAQVPWDASKIQTEFRFLDRDPGVPSRVDSQDRIAAMRAQSLRSLGAVDAYFITLTRDTFDGYADFIAEYWQDAMANRVQALLAARREAITWWRTYQANVPDAYWTYLDRYPRGPHAADARSLLGRLGASSTLPSRFARMEYDVPPPLPDELPYIERTVLKMDDPEFSFEPPPPLPVYFLGPPPREWSELPKAAGPPADHVPSVPDVAPIPDKVGVAAGAMLPSPTLPSNNSEEGMAVRGTIDAPIRQDSKVTPLSVSPAVASRQKELAKTQPETIAPSREETMAPSQSSDTPPMGQKPTDRTSSILGGESPAPSSPRDERPLYAPIIASPSIAGRPPGARDKPWRTPGAIPLPTSRPAMPGRPTPARTSGATHLPPQANAGQSIPPTTGNAPSPGSRPATSVRLPLNGQSKPTAHTVLTSPPKLPDQQQQSVSAPPKPAVPPKVKRAAASKPNLPPPSLPKNPCTVVDGKQSCD
jgi:uncharacterized caspase-like protein